MQQDDFPLAVLAIVLVLVGVALFEPSWMGLAAFWTAIFTAVLTLSTVLLWRETGVAANAAMLSAKSLTKAERAYVKLSHTSPGVKWIGLQGDFTVSIRVKNFGDTPAEITDVVITWRYREGDKDLPIVPDYDIANR